MLNFTTSPLETGGGLAIFSFVWGGPNIYERAPSLLHRSAKAPPRGHQKQELRPPQQFLSWFIQGTTAETRSNLFKRHGLPAH